MHNWYQSNIPEEVRNVLDALNFFNHIFTIAIILAVAYIALKISEHFVSRLVRRTVRAKRFKTAKDQVQREDTIISILKTALRALIWVTAGLMILGDFGVNIGPLLAGAGVLGVALGFGAQTMVKDFLAGIFIIAENQYRVGDVLQVNQTVAGVVEKISLRATVLRDLEGKVHYIPNGVIEIATNMTLEYAQVDLNIGVAYGSDLDQVEKVINKMGEKIFADNEWKGVVLEAPYMMRVDAFADSSIIVKIVCKTAPIRQWDVKGEILRRVKVAFEKEGIEIPFPQVVVGSPASFTAKRK